MKNIVVISPQLINIFKIKTQTPTFRWIHFHCPEEGIAAISLHGNKIHCLYLDITTTYLPSTSIYTILKSEFKSLPILLFKTANDIHMSLEDSTKSNCISTYKDLQTFTKLK